LKLVYVKTIFYHYQPLNALDLLEGFETLNKTSPENLCLTLNALDLLEGFETQGAEN